MTKTYCNPLDLSYRYQHFKVGDRRWANREGADPTIVFFHDRYFLFVSMSAGFWHSSDLISWEFHAATDLCIYDYAPDVRVVGEYLYFTASRAGSKEPILRTKDPLKEPFEEVARPLEVWDPDLFVDDDGRIYEFWGCSDTTPIRGVELDGETLQPMGEPVDLIWGHPETIGYERPGEGGVVEGERKPYIEGPYLTKHGEKYYLQYAAPGTEFGIYSDGVYVADAPLGPYRLQVSNPFSSVPGGFIRGAGHGSTIAGRCGNYWHVSTEVISVNHDFERRVGLFPAGVDEDGLLFCNQNFADYPHRVPTKRVDVQGIGPEWMLLSFGKKVSASSTAPGSDASWAVNETIKNWWSADSAEYGEWLMVDLGGCKDVRAIQVNLADEKVSVELPDGLYHGDRYIDTNALCTRYRVEASADGQRWQVIAKVEEDRPHGYFEIADGMTARFVRVVGGELPYGQVLRISGLRVFGCSDVAAPVAVSNVLARRVGTMDAHISWCGVPGAIGYNVRYGVTADKLYHSWLVYDATEVDLCTLVAGQSYYIEVDAFGEGGITPGDVVQLAGI